MATNTSRVNLLYNPSFQNGSTAGWTTYQSAAIEAALGSALYQTTISGSYFAKVTKSPSTSRNGISSDYISIASPASVFALSAYVKVPLGSEDIIAGLSVYWYDSAGNQLSYTDSIDSNKITVTPSTNGWVRLGLVTTAPLGAAKLKAVILDFKTSSSSASNYFYVDGLLLEEFTELPSGLDYLNDPLSSKNLTSNPSYEITSGSTATTRTNLAYNPSFELSSGTVTTRTNLIVNPSFETSSNTVVTRTNLVTNPNSEAAALGSEGAGAGTVSQSTTQKVFGTYSSKYVWTSGSWGPAISGGAITVAQNTTYYISFYVFVESGTMPTIQIAATDYSTNPSSISPSTTIGAWVRLSKSYTTAAGQTTLRVWGTGTSAGTYYVDGVLIEPARQLQPYFDGLTPAAIRTNLVTNPNMEASISGNYGSNQGSAALTTAQAYVGTQSIIFTGNGSTGGGIYPTGILATPGLTYTSSIYIRDNNSAATFLAGIEWKNSSGSTISSVYGAQVAVSANGWIRLSVTGAAPTGTVGAVPVFYSVDAVANGKSVYFDAALFEESSTVADYFDGSTSAANNLVYGWRGTANASQSYYGSVDYTYAWGTLAVPGTANASQSIQKAPSVDFFFSPSSDPTLLPVSRSTEQKYLGSYSLKVGPFTYTRPEAQSTGLTLDTTETYTISVYVYSSIARNITLGYTGGGDVLNAIPANTWTRISRTFTPSVAATSFYLTEPVSTSGIPFYFDNMMVEKGSNLYYYFDGSTSAVYDYTHGWSGTANASTSTQSLPAITGYAAGNATVGKTYVTAFNGTYSGLVTSTSSAGQIGLYSSPVSVTPGLTYTSSIYVKDLNLSASITTNIDWYGSSGYIMSTAGSGAALSGSWQRLSTTGIAPVGATQAIMTIYSSATAPLGKQFYIDAALFEKTGTLDPYFDGANPPAIRQNLASNPSFEASSGVVTVRANLITDPGFEISPNVFAIRTNLVTNPNFESGSVWSSYTTSAAPTIDSVVFYAGTKSMKVTAQAGVTSGVYVSLATTAGATYTFSAYVKGEVGKSINITIADFSGTLGSGPYISETTTSTTATGDWQRISVTRTLDGSTTWSNILLRNGSSTVAHTFNVDNVLFEQSSVLGTYFDGNTTAAGDYTYAWDTTANASKSYQKAPAVGPIWSFGWNGVSGGAFYAHQTATDSVFGTKAMKVVNSGYSSTTLIGSTPTGLIIGRNYTYSYYVKPSVTRDFRIATNTASYISQPWITCPAGRWTRVSGTFTASATATTVWANTETAATPGDVYLFDGFMLENSLELSSYFDGSFTDTAEFDYGWSGTANASISYQNAPAPVVNWNSGQLFPYQSQLYSYTGTKSMATLITNSVNTDNNIGYSINGYYGDAGTYTYSAYYYIPQGSTLAGRFVTYSIDGVTTGITLISKSDAALIPGTWVRASITYSTSSTTPYGNGYEWSVVHRLSGDMSTVAGQIVYTDGLLIEKSATAGEYFDGNTADTTKYNYGWYGTANQSKSYITSADYSYSWAGATNASNSLQAGKLLTDWYSDSFIVSQSGTETRNGSYSIKLINPTGSIYSNAYNKPSGSRIAVAAGQIYTFSFYIKNINSTSGWFAALKGFTGSSGGTSTYIKDGPITAISTGSWTRISVTAAIPVGISYIEAWIVNYSGETPGASVYVDPAILVELKYNYYINEYIQSIDNLAQNFTPYSNDISTDSGYQSKENQIVNTSLSKVQPAIKTGLKLRGDININGLTLNAIDDNNVVWVCTDIEGWWNLAPVELQDTPRGLSDGSYDNIGRFTARELVLHGSILTPSPDLAPAARQKLIDAINLVKTSGWLYIDEGPVKAIEVRLSAVPEITSVNARGRIDFSIPLKAANPIKYSWNWSQPDGYSTVSIPTGTGTFSKTATIYNEGNSPVPILMTFNGKFSDVTVTNTTTDASLSVNKTNVQTMKIADTTAGGVTMQNSNVLSIDTYSQVVLLDGGVTGTISGNSVRARQQVGIVVDWIKLAPGRNDIVFAGGNGDSSSTSLTIKYRSGWIG